MAVIVVTGCVGVGKTTLSRKLSRELGFTYVDVHSVLKNYSLKEKYDKEKKCWVVNISKLVKALKKVIKKERNVVIDSHLGHYLDKKDVDLCIVVRCDLRELKKRLKSRKYSVKKVKENLECEVFDFCTTEALELGHNILVVKGDKPLSLEILDCIKRKRI